MPGNSYMLHSGSFAPPWSSYFLQLIPVLQITQAWNHSHFYSIFSHHSIEPITFYDKDLYWSFLHKVSHIRPFLSRSPFPPNSSPITSSLKTTVVSSLGPHLQLLSKIALRPGCPPEESWVPSTSYDVCTLLVLTWQGCSLGKSLNSLGLSFPSVQLACSTKSHVSFA